MDTDKSKIGATPAATGDAVADAPSSQTDAVSPVAQAETSTSSVVAAPPEEAQNLAVSDDIAEQIAADSAIPPASEPPIANGTTTGVELPDVATPPAESTETSLPDAEDSSEPPKEQADHEAAAPIAAVTKAPKTHNPARSAVVITILLMIVLAALAVFAYSTSQ